LELDAASARTWDYLGRSLQQQGKIDDARAAMERAITVDPDYMLPIIGLIELENTAHRTQNAVQLSDSIVLAAERSAATVDVRDLVHKRADGSELRPSRSFINLIRFERSRLEAAASQAYLDTGQMKKCIAAAREAYLLDHTSLKVALLFSEIMIQEGKPEAAKTLLH
jgi:tetratricopeptide (TPR) repeat protein